MSEKQYYLVSGTSAQELERLTGLRGRNTSHGVLVEKPSLVGLGEAMATLRRAFPKPQPTCTCRGVIHQRGCPAGNWMT